MKVYFIFIDIFEHAKADLGLCSEMFRNLPKYGF